LGFGELERDGSAVNVALPIASPLEFNPLQDFRLQGSAETRFTLLRRFCFAACSSSSTEDTPSSL